MKFTLYPSIYVPVQPAIVVVSPPAVGVAATSVVVVQAMADVLAANLQFSSIINDSMFTKR